MIVVMKPETPAAVIQQLMDTFQTWALAPEEVAGTQPQIIGLFGHPTGLDAQQVAQTSHWIDQVIPLQQPFKRASRTFRYGVSTTVAVDTPRGVVTFGQNCPLVSVAGPCSVESEKMIVETALALQQSGAQFLRGGAYKPRSSPYAFQGYGHKALDWLAEARRVSGLGIITEVMSADALDAIAAVADILQIGARNMQNFSLLKAVGRSVKPVLLKRGLSATIDDWLMAAEYILAAGNPNVILCERGIRTFDRTYTRNTLDLTAIPVLRALTHLPVMIDPSHGTGKSAYVPTMAKAAVIAGADALMIEVHPNPKAALSDGPQSLTPDQYEMLMRELAPLSQLLGRWPHNNDLAGVAAPTVSATAPSAGAMGTCPIGLPLSGLPLLQTVAGGKGA